MLASSSQYGILIMSIIYPTVTEVIWSAKCPMCQSEDVEEGAPAFERDNLIYVEKLCEHCGAEWNDRYIFDGIDFIDNTEVYKEY